MHRRTDDFPTLSSRSMALLYARTMAGYLLLMATMWVVGFEGIYAHPTPFYALFAPVGGVTLASAVTLLLTLGACVAFAGIRSTNTLRPFVAATVIIAGSCLVLLVREANQAGVSVLSHLAGLFPALAWQMPAAVVFAGGAWLFSRYVIPKIADDCTLSTRETRRLLLGIFGFSIIFACAIAMMRDGLQGIDQAYSRAAYEYVGDIGKTRSIRALFTRYLEIHEHLSMHAKVHPPGPIALLWLMSYFVGNGAFGLSLATVVFSALAVFPLYGWAKRISNPRCALIACICYVLAPTVVLFTATSADALFTPFTLSTLYCFERAIRTRSARFALAAGAGYGCMMLLKFSLIGIGAYFGLAGLWMLVNPETRWNVLQTAVLMLAAAAGVVWGVYLWSGFDLIETFNVARQQFYTDQLHLDELAPRLPFWTYKLLNPLCWFYFAGIPLSLLSLRELLRPEPGHRPTWIIFVLTLAALNLLYLARGEGERSAMYMIPFIAVPAAFHLERMLKRQRDNGPLWATVVFLAFQCWFTEAFFYTYW